MLPDPVFGRDFKQCWHITLTNALDIDGSALFVGFVIAVWIEFLHGPSFVILIGVNYVINSFF